MPAVMLGSQQGWGGHSLERMGVVLCGVSSCNPLLACREDTTKPQSVALGCGMCLAKQAQHSLVLVTSLSQVGSCSAPPGTVGAL